MGNANKAGPWVLKHISGSNFAVQRFEIRSGSGMPHPIFNKDTSAIDGTSVCMSPQDAKLIAAAPDMLKALEGVVNRCKGQGYVGVDGQYLKVIRAAIAKATE